MRIRLLLGLLKAQHFFYRLNADLIKALQIRKQHQLDPYQQEELNCLTDPDAIYDFHLKRQKQFLDQCLRRTELF